MKSILCSAALLASFALAPIAYADDDDRDNDGGIDTDHLFSFNAGTDTGRVGEKEVQTGLSGRFGRSRGTYSALTGELSFQYTPMRNLTLSVATLGTYHAIDGVPGMGNRHAANFGGLSLGVTYRLLDRGVTGLGLALLAEPHWARIDETTGEPIDGYGADFRLAADAEILPGRLIGGVNLVYQPEVKRSRLDGTWSRENTAGIGAGLMLKLRDDIFAGFEARYLRSYETLNFSGFAGQAFFLGPSMSVMLSKRSWLAVGWSAQIAGRATATGGTLDLTNFSGHEVRLAWGAQF